MNIRGEIVFGRILFLFVFFFFLIDFSSALSVTPARIEMNFQPNAEQTIDYRVFSAKPGVEYQLYLQGDLSEYAKLSKEKINGDGDFKVFLKMPSSIEIPGYHSLYVGVKEIGDEELLGGSIGTTVEILVLVSIYAPYPGKYVESTLSAKNVNIGEPVEFQIEIINRGKEDVTIFPSIEIYSNQTSEKIETLSLNERFLGKEQELSLRKVLDTSSYNPGKYKGVSIIEYGGASPSIKEVLFRIGSLGIEIKNYTSIVSLEEKIHKFDIDIESNWNDNIDGAYAEVSFYNQTGEVISFKTSSTGLVPFESKTITGYFDTTNFAKGIYNANLSLYYYGKDVGKSTSKIVQVEFVEKSYPILLISLIAIAGLILVAGIIVFIVKRKSNSQNEKNKIKK